MHSPTRLAIATPRRGGAVPGGAVWPGIV